MAQSAANLVDHVLPEVPLRQYVVTFPFELRARLAYDGRLLSSLTRIAKDSILGFYKRRARDDKNIKGQSGTAVAVQRVSSDLRLNPHLHAIVIDGVFAGSSVRSSTAFGPTSCATPTVSTRVRVALSVLIRAIAVCVVPRSIPTDST